MSHTEPLSDPKLHDLAELFSQLSAELGGQNVGEMLRILREGDLSLPRLVALTYLDRHGAATISELSEHLHLALGTTSHAVEQLVRSGYVERREDELDRRHKQVTLTPAGAALVATVRRIRTDELVRRLGALPPELIVRLQALLAELLDVLQNTHPESGALSR